MFNYKPVNYNNNNNFEICWIIARKTRFHRRFERLRQTFRRNTYKIEVKIYFKCKSNVFLLNITLFRRGQNLVRKGGIEKIFKISSENFKIVIIKK